MLCLIPLRWNYHSFYPFFHSSIAPVYLQLEDVLPDTGSVAWLGGGCPHRSAAKSARPVDLSPPPRLGAVVASFSLQGELQFFGHD